jgi:hypothetical protein
MDFDDVAWTKVIRFYVVKKTWTHNIHDIRSRYSPKNLYSTHNSQLGMKI